MNQGFLFFLAAGERAGLTRQTEERLILDYGSFLWSDIEHITLKRSELGNRYLAIYFRDDTPPASCDIDMSTREEDVIEFINQLQEKAARKGFTFTSEIDLKLPKKVELPREAEPTGEPSPAKQIEVSEKQKMYAMIILAVVFFVGIYAILGLEFALSIFVVVLVHEAGHYVALKFFHMKAHGLFFIPFVGAGVVPKDEFPSPKVEAAVSLGGPGAGLVLTVFVYLFRTVGVFPSTGLLLELIDSILIVNVIINLLNLMPILPLDGGTLVRAALLRGRKSVIPVGLVTIGSGLAVAILLSSLFFMMIALLGLGSLIHSYNQMKTEEAKPPSWGMVFLILAAWILVIFLYLFAAVVVF